MRTLATLTAGAVVLLALAGCSNDPKSGIAALEAPAGQADTFADGGKDLGGINADSARLLVKEDDHVFYTAMPNDPSNGSVCVVVENMRADTAYAGCGVIPSVEPLTLETADVKAKLIVDDYDPSKELAEGWRQLHKNLLVHP